MTISPESVAMMERTREEQGQMLAALVRDGHLKVWGRWFEAVVFVRLLAC